MLELSCLGNCDGCLDTLSRLQPCATMRLAQLRGRHVAFFTF